MSIKKSLQSLFQEAYSFTKNDFHLLSYVYTLTLIFGCIYLNYTTGFYRDVMNVTYNSGNSMWAFPLFYSFMYFAVAIPILIFQKEYKIIRNKGFFLKSLFFIVLYGVASGYCGYREWEFASLFTEEKYFLFRIAAQLKGSFIILIPLILLKISIDKKVDGFYGIARNTKHIHGYLTLFALLIPFLIVTSFTPDFLNAYPQFRPWLYEDIFGWPVWVSTLLFETIYALDFVITELVFRGALVIGMISILGRKAILPMVAMYVSIHFGKPLGETLSSIFGGYVLGALAYQTRHIWGGIIVHICLALTMEIMGFVHYYLLK